jgi:hypothetical protein
MRSSPSSIIHPLSSSRWLLAIQRLANQIKPNPSWSKRATGLVASKQREDGRSSRAKCANRNFPPSTPDPRPWGPQTGKSNYLKLRQGIFYTPRAGAAPVAKPLARRMNTKNAMEKRTTDHWQPANDKPANST